MTLHLERDIELTHQFWRLRQLMHPNDAFILLWCLYKSLAYQIEIHGAAGFFSAAEATPFVEGLPIKVQDPIGSLVQAGFLVAANEGWRCPLFESSHCMYDKDWIPEDDDPRVELWRNALERVNKETPEALKNLPAECLTDKEGKPIPMEKLTRCVMLVKTVDATLGFARRKPEEFDVAIIQQALEVVNSFPDDLQRELILQRIYRKRNLRGVPRNTIQLLKRFETTMLLVDEQGRISIQMDGR